VGLRERAKISRVIALRRDRAQHAPKRMETRDRQGSRPPPPGSDGAMGYEFHPLAKHLSRLMTDEEIDAPRRGHA